MAARNLAFNDRIEENAVQVFLGESVLAKANVNRLNIMGSRNSGARGTLFVTNFKVAFTSNCGGGYDFKKPSSLDKLLSEEVDDKDDIIPLTVIEHLFAISTSKQKRKKIKDASKELSSHYDIIEIVTKDFRIIQYDFKLTSEESRKPLIKMLSHYSFPTALSRLFAFDYGKKAWQPNTNLTERAFCTYSHAKDYELDLNRLGASEQWRVSKVNVEYRLCKSLPQYNVCPASLDDESIVVAASKYPNNRFPVWLWSDSSTGAALLLSSQLKNDTSLTMHEHPVTITESIRNKGHTTGETISIDIGSPCPTLKQLKSSFKKLKRECIFRSSKDFWESDSSWLGDIEQTGWLSHVSSCLELVHDIIKKINEKQTSVIVCDPDGRHFAILITSLVQILLDPYYRSLMGLQALIQKDWVMKGFPFCQRLHHISESSKSTIGSQIRTASFKGKDERRDKDLTYEGESPVFVLFLECLHQLIRQHPLEFEYTEQFLVLLYDASYSCLFGTFLFNSSYELDESQKESNLMTVWDFIATNIPQSKYISVFTNASYKLDLEQDIDLTDGGLTSNMQRKMSLHLEHRNSVITDIVSAIPRLLIWNSLFFRWLPCTDFHKGCSREVVLQLQQIQYMDEIYYLKDRLNQLQQQMQPRDFLSPEPDSSTRNKKRHKRNASRFSNNEEVRDDFLIIMTGFHFLKML